jgi:hypothetical protein
MAQYWNMVNGAIAHICDEHLRDHVDWIRRLTGSS